jgi:hypothetical protein
MNVQEVREKMEKGGIGRGLAFVIQGSSTCRFRWGSLCSNHTSIEEYLEKVKKIFPNCEVRTMLKQPCPWSFREVYLEVVCLIR